MTNKQKILNLLEKNEWVCTSQMYALYIADPRTLLSPMHEQGIVENRWCQNPNHHHKGNQKEWRLIDRTGLTHTSPEPTKAICCTSYVFFKIHDRNCVSNIREPLKENVLF